MLFLLHATEFIIEFKTLFDSIADTPDPLCITVGTDIFLWGSSFLLCSIINLVSQESI